MNTENTNITCPDCRGALKRLEDGEMVQFQCRVGHLYSPQSAVSAHLSTEENAVWAAIVALEEGADLLDEVSKYLDGDLADGFTSAAALRRDLAKRVRDVLKDLRNPQLG